MPKKWTQPDVALAELVATLTPGRALDVGCGGGHDSFWLAEQGWSVVAMDTSRHAVGKVRKAAAERNLDVSAVRADVTNLDAEREYDLVSVCYMHLPATDRAKMLTNVSRALVGGGTALFRSFEASIEEAPFDRDLLPSKDDVVTELGDDVIVEQADVGDDYFPYMNREMKLLTVRAVRR